MNKLKENKQMLTNKQVKELLSFVRSVEHNKKTYTKDHELEEYVATRSKELCEEYGFNITHGSAYKELRHKSYYYKDKYFKTIINEHIDLYGLREAHIITDKEIVNKLLEK